MLTLKANYHHSKMPKIGEIGYITSGTNRYNETLFYKGLRQKYQVVAYPLNDNVYPYSIGIHTAFFKNLRTNEVQRFSGFYFESIS